MHLPFKSSLIRVTGLLCVLALAGCAGITPGKSPSVEFTVPLTVKQTYDRAMAQTQYCLVTNDQFPVKADIAADGQQAQIEVLMTFTSEVMARVNMQAQSASSTRVNVQMWGESVWDQSAVDAMQAAIQFGVPSCTNYFPSPDTGKQTVIKQRR